MDTVAAVAMKSMEKAVTEANEKSGDSEVQQCVHMYTSKCKCVVRIYYSG